MMELECFECGDKTEVEHISIARDQGWMPEPGCTGQPGRREICPRCMITLGYRSRAQFEAVRDWYRRQRERETSVLSHVCDSCGATFEGTMGEARALRWKKTWRTVSKGLRCEYLRCPDCRKDRKVLQ